MVTGLMFTLSQRGKALAQSDTTQETVGRKGPASLTEGKRFPPLIVVSPTAQVLVAAKTAGVALALIGLALYVSGTIGWSAGPNGFYIETPQVVADALTGATS